MNQSEELTVIKKFISNFQTFIILQTMKLLSLLWKLKYNFQLKERLQKSSNEINYNVLFTKLDKNLIYFQSYKLICYQNNVY